MIDGFPLQQPVRFSACTPVLQAALDAGMFAAAGCWERRMVCGPYAASFASESEPDRCRGRAPLKIAFRSLVMGSRFACKHRNWVFLVILATILAVAAAAK
ncbi:hypothetical protein ACFQY7_05155 [Actinomadura luteofluorescens]|uniref:Uncharacterized protein n=1 Tax=Actinomadura luteofluorescens TaxID=46163 RepID=A0A7Y9JD83_9ACTN|nr:hypothetical protein [Actinomadura luteofluorescens]NYD44767.1 hypothetical protein [Actinomadura luteofluorescens]